MALYTFEYLPVKQIFIDVNVHEKANSSLSKNILDDTVKECELGQTIHGTVILTFLSFVIWITSSLPPHTHLSFIKFPVIENIVIGFKMGIPQNGQ